MSSQALGRVANVFERGFESVEEPVGDFDIVLGQIFSGFYQID